MKQGDVFFSGPGGVYKAHPFTIGWLKFVPGMFPGLGYWYRRYGVSASEMQIRIIIKAAIPEE